MTPLPKRSCGRCANWTRSNPDDLTAPEGRCQRSENPGHWPTGYWPATLQRDGCRTGFKRAPTSILSNGEA